MSLPGPAWLFQLTVLTLLLPALVRGQEIVINEVMADNQSIAPLLDFPDYFPDYVELYNRSARDINLAAEGWSLSTKKNPGFAPFFDFKDFFYFPPGLVFSADSYLLIFFDNKTNFPGIHTTFKVHGTNVDFSLKRTGDDVLLFKGSSLVDSNFFGVQVPDLAVGRVPDGSGPFTLIIPSPYGFTPSSGALDFQPNTPFTNFGNPFALKINEWLSTNSAGANKDWFEIYNPDTNVVVLSGLVFTDNHSNQVAALRPVVPLSYIAPLGFAQFFASDSAQDANEVDFSLSSGSSGPCPPTGSPLDEIWMFASDRSTVIDHVFSRLCQKKDISEGRVPDGGDTIIQLPGLSPEASNFGSIPEVVINEVLTHTDPPLMDAVELLNVTNVAVNLGGWWLSNNKQEPQKMQIPFGTTIPPGGFKVFYETQFNTGPKAFTFNSANGDECYLFKADTNGNLTGFRRGIDFGPAENGVSFGRYLTSEGKVDITAMSARSFGVDNPTTTNQFLMGSGETNPYPKVGPLVINEIYYHPPPFVTATETNDNTLDEFIEFQNITRNTLLLYDPNIYRDDAGIVLPRGTVYADGHTNTWRVRGGVSFNFPANDLTLAAGAYLLLVNFDPGTNAAFTATWRTKFIPPIPNTVALYGPYKGKLSNGGAAIELYKPDAPQGPQHPDFRLVPYILVDKVKYSDKTPWPTSADGLGASLQRLISSNYGNDPINWRADEPTPGHLNSVLASDVTRPSVAITAPAANKRFTEPVMNISGTAKDNVALDHVEYQLGSGPFLMATGTTVWSAQIAMSPGTNVVRARSIDAAGNVSLTNQRSFYYVMTSPLTLSTNGHGAVAGATNGQRLEIGRAYSLTATPSPGFVFSNWTGDVSGVSPKLTFTMQPDLAVTANFVNNPYRGSIGKFNGLFYDSNGVEHGSSGFFSFSLTERGTYSASLLTGGRKLSAAGQLNLEGKATNTILRTGTTPLTVVWSVAFDGSDRITGAVSDGSWTAELDGDRAVFNARSNPSGLAGKYTLNIPGTPGATLTPEGNSYGTVTIDGNGVVSLKGSLSDKTSAVQKVPVSKNGEWPLYVPLYAGKGSLFSWVSFMPRDQDDFHGALMWSKPALPTAKYYPSGFIDSYMMTGSRYVAPVGATNRILALTEAVVLISGGNLPQSYTNHVILGLNSRVTSAGPDKLSLSFTLSSGLFKGSFTPGDVGKAVSISGAVLQKATNAAGFFLGTSQCGSVSLTAPPAP